MLREYVKVGEVEKKKYGEVMTPLELVKEMLATLPKEVWSNPNLKWLDPANGTGPYPLIVIWRLMQGLKEWEPDAEKRYKHIVENMIYVCELQPKNMFLYMCLVDPYDEYQLNVYTGSFLTKEFDYHMKEVWGLEKFDIIIGNPPYNNAGGLEAGGKNLYSKFIISSLKIMNKDGYLCFITNAGFLKSTDGNRSEIISSLLSGNLIYINLNECKKHFPGVGGAMIFCYFLFQNNVNYTITECVSQLDEKSTVFKDKISLKSLNWIPRILTNETISIIKKFNNKKYNFIRLDGVENSKKVNKKMIGFKRLSHLVRPYSVKATSNIDKGTWILTESDNKEADVDFFNSRYFSFLNVIHRYDPIIYHKILCEFGPNKEYLTESEDNFINKIIEY